MRSDLSCMKCISQSVSGSAIKVKFFFARAIPTAQILHYSINSFLVPTFTFQSCISSVDKEAGSNLLGHREFDEFLSLNGISNLHFSQWF